ncbi:MAG TPA: alpha/beta hydrolase [Planctomycetota bacterium]|nr:alpha/beta hydrolase [Planctomycetota bacterium]
MAEPSDLGLAFENVELVTGDDTPVHAWFVPASGNDGRTVLLCHGNAADISFYHPYYSFLHAAGWNVLLHDHRGHGRSRCQRDVGGLLARRRCRTGSTPARCVAALNRCTTSPSVVARLNPGASTGRYVRMEITILHCTS